MIHLTGTVLGDVQLDRALTRIISESEDLSGPFEDFGDEFRELLKDRFEAEGFGDWPPLSIAYALEKLRRYGPKTILRATDKLFRSLTIKGAEGNITRIFPLTAEFGTSIFYAVFHQKGTTRMPAREIMMLREEDKRRLVRTIQRHMIASGQVAGFQIIAE